MAKSKFEFNSNTIRVVLEDGASMPEQAHSQDVGYDIKSISCEYDEEHDMYIYHTGIHMESDIENGFVKSIYIFPRSSNSKKECYLTNSVGIDDVDIYQGEIQVRFKNRTSIETMIHTETCKRMLNDIVSDKYLLGYNEMYDIVKNEILSKARHLKYAPYDVGDKCAQIVFAAEIKPNFIQTEKLTNKSDRGTGGFGDSGK